MVRRSTWAGHKVGPVCQEVEHCRDCLWNCVDGLLIPHYLCSGFWSPVCNPACNCGCTHQQLDRHMIFFLFLFKELNPILTFKLQFQYVLTPSCILFKQIFMCLYVSVYNSCYAVVHFSVADITIDLNHTHPRPHILHQCTSRWLHCMHEDV